MRITTNARTIKLVSNDNISFPVGTAFAVKKYIDKLNLESIFLKFKQKGISLIDLIEVLVTYRLSENLSLNRASDWINRSEVLKFYDLEPFNKQTFYRAVKIIGANYQEIILDLQDTIFSNYDFENTDSNLDWSSIVLWGNKANLGKYGYSRDHRPDKKQITFGVSELRKPVNIPIGLTIAKGNVNDQMHFQTTFNQIKSRLNDDSLIIFDRGANSQENINSVIAAKMKFLTAKNLNSSDDKLIKDFWNQKPELINSKEEIYGIKREFPSRINYFFFSEKLKEENLESANRRAQRQLTEAKSIELAATKGKPLPKRFRINNVLVDTKIEYQTKLKNLSELQAFELVKNATITGREGFFCLSSNENLTLKEALTIYREKDSVEKIMHSLKNEINIKPLRVWSDESIRGALLIGFLAQLIISLIKYDEPELKNCSTKFIKISLSNLTVTIEKLKTGKKRLIYSNFEPINQIICLKNEAIT